MKRREFVRSMLGLPLAAAGAAMGWDKAEEAEQLVELEALDGFQKGKPIAGGIPVGPMTWTEGTWNSNTVFSVTVNTSGWEESNG